jgi:hypothetical protein
MQPVSDLKAGDGRPSVPLADKKPKRIKPGFADFLEELKRSACTEPRKQRLASMLRVIKGGYKGKPSPTDFEAVFGVVASCSECSRLALRILTLARSKKPPELIRFLRARLVSHAQAIVGYPSRMHMESQDQRREILLSWADAAAKQREEQGSENTDLAIWALVSLMDEPLLVRTDPIYVLLERLAGKDWHTSKLEADDCFFLEVMKLVGAGKVSGHRIAVGLALAIGARSCGGRLRDELVTAEAGLKAEQDCVRDLRKEVAGLDERLQAAAVRIAEMEDLLRRKSEEVEKEKRERGLDEEHWESQTEQRLIKMASGISARLSHEISEAKLCLDGDSPNLQMALGRLRKMEEALAKLREI